MIWPKCLETEKSRDRNCSDRNGQTEKSRAPRKNAPEV